FPFDNFITVSPPPLFFPKRHEPSFHSVGPKTMPKILPFSSVNWYMLVRPNSIFRHGSSLSFFIPPRPPFERAQIPPQAAVFRTPPSFQSVPCGLLCIPAGIQLICWMRKPRAMSISSY
ncbi:unnamed protein product, partial [Linum tenue]